MVEADIHIRLFHTSMVDTFKAFEPLVCCLKGIVAPLYRYTSQVGLRFGKSGPLEVWKGCHNNMVEADIHFRLIHTSILDIYKVFEPLVCCLKGSWLHSYTITLAKLAPDLEIQGHLRSRNDATTSCLRLMSTSDCFLHPYQIYTQCLSLWYAVSRAYSCTLMPLHQPSWPQIWGFRVT